MKKENITKTIIIAVVSGFVLSILSPLAMSLSNGVTGIFSTPQELRATNEMIRVKDSTRMRQLRDSCFIFRGIIKNQHDRIADVENQIKTLITKNHLR